MKSSKMKAVVCTGYGSPDVLQVFEVEQPKPKHNEVLIKVHAAAATTADSMMRRADPFYSRLFLGLLKPRNAIMGTGFAGQIIAIGEEVKTFKEGDQVFGETGLQFGANAEYICMPSDGVLALKPENLSYEEAAPICDGALTSLNYLKLLANIRAGQKVLINGASGALGTSAVQLAYSFGAEVTGVCGPSNLELVKTLGADHVIDYTTTDFTQTGETYDIIFDTVGKRSFSECKKVLSAKGCYLSPVLKFSLLFQVLRTALFGGKKAIFSATGLLPPTQLRALLNELIELFEAGHLKSVIGRAYTLEQAVQAHQYIDTGHKRGNIVFAL